MAAQGLRVAGRVRDAVALRDGWSAALAVTATLLAALACLGNGFVLLTRPIAAPRMSNPLVECGIWVDETGRHSFADLVSSDARWAIVAGYAFSAAAWFWFWRRLDFRLGRWIGAATSAAAAASAICVILQSPRPVGYDIEGTFVALIAAIVLLAAAYVVAPEWCSSKRAQEARSSLRLRPSSWLPEELRIRRASWTVTLLVVSVLVAYLPTAIDESQHGTSDWGRVLLLDRVTDDPAWAVPVATVLIAPVWYWVWRRSAVTWGRGAGLALCAAAAIAPTMLRCDDGELGSRGLLLVAANGLSFWAFVFAPFPDDPSATGDLEVRLALRRHRGEVPRMGARVREAARRARDRGARRVAWAATLTAAGPVIALLPSALHENARWRPDWDRVLLLDRMMDQPAWAAPLLSLALIPLWYWIWRRTAIVWARGTGCAAAGAAALAVVVADLDAYRVDERTYFLLTGHVAMLVAFVVAPEPPSPDAARPLEDRRALRRHRAANAVERPEPGC